MRSRILVLAVLLAFFVGTPLTASLHLAAAQEADVSPLPPALQPIDPASAEAEFQTLTNELRAEHGLRALQLSTAATEVGVERSWGLVECGLCSFDHQIPGVGFAPFWITSQIKGAIGSGENLGASVGPNDQFVGSLFRDWVDSPSHLENLLRPQWTHMGVGIVELRQPRGMPVKVVTHIFVMAGGPLSRA